jgi:hypothetical protein
LLLKVFIKTPPVFFALPHAVPFCNFFRHAFCTGTLAAHCNAEASQRAAPTLRAKRHAKKVKRRAILT